MQRPSQVLIEDVTVFDTKEHAAAYVDGIAAGVCSGETPRPGQARLIPIKSLADAYGAQRRVDGQLTSSVVVLRRGRIDVYLVSTIPLVDLEKVARTAAGQVPAV